MEISKYRDRLITQSVSLPGSRDVLGSPVMIIIPPPLITSNTPSIEEGTDMPLSYSQLVSIIGYLSSIPSQQCVDKGFTMIIDGRNVSPKIVRIVLRAIEQGLYKKVKQAVIIQPEKFLDQQKLNIELLLEAFNFKVPCVSIHKLSKFVPISSLPEIFGGVYPYDVNEWISNREKVEKTIRELEACLNGLRIEGVTSLNETQSRILKSGEELANSLATSSSNEDDHYAALILRRLVGQSKDILNEPARKAKVESELETARLAEEHTGQMNSLLDWLEGPGETWLLSLKEIGESRDEASQLVKQHQQLKIKVQELNNQREELSEMASKLMESLPVHASIIDKSRIHFKTMVSSFSSRVQRGFEMAERSEIFHDKMNMFTRRADSLLDSLCCDIAAQEPSSVINQRTKMEEEVTQLKEAFDDLMGYGREFIQDLTSNEIIPFGKKSNRDYSAGVMHIREQLNSANERRRRCLDLVDVRLLKLQQIIQLYTCEKDAEQSIEWLKEMNETLNRDYGQIEYSLEEIDHLREDQSKLEAAARSTYEYGKDLCQVALVLRRSLRMEQKKGMDEKLEQICSQLCRCLSEKEAKLTLTQGYLDTIEEVEKRLDDMERKANNARDRPAKNVYMSSERRKIALQLGDLKHLGDAICCNINRRESIPIESRSSKVKSIYDKIDSLVKRQERIESTLNE